MTVTNTSTLSIFTSPLTVPVAPPNTNANSVDATAPGGTLLGGESKTYSTTNFETDPQNVVLTGTGNRLNIGGGAANVSVLGGGQIIESAQFLGTDSGKLISIELNTTNGAANASDVNATVDLNQTVTGNTVDSSVSIAAAGGDMAPNPTNFYVHGGTGDDTIIGSFLNDFIRGGAGDDVINAFGGNDLLRGGSGSDSIDLGAGLDTLFYTTDQVVTGDSDTLTAFTSGEDLLVFDKGIDTTLVFSGGDDTSGYTSVTFTASGNTTTLNVVSGAIKKSDITFLT
jgi:Ca2+-binding RTX toxin-like protein